MTLLPVQCNGLLHLEDKVDDQIDKRYLDYILGSVFCENLLHSHIFNTFILQNIELQLFRYSHNLFLVIFISVNIFNFIIFVFFNFRCNDSWFLLGEPLLVENRKTFIKTFNIFLERRKGRGDIFQMLSPFFFYSKSFCEPDILLT